MKRAYLCVPMRNRDIKAIKADIERLKRVVAKDGYEAVYDEPRDLGEINENGYLAMMGATLAEIATCDVVVFAGGWHVAGGCRLIRDACDLYDITMWFVDEKSPDGLLDDIALY